jgi:hypothetical protein
MRLTTLAAALLLSAASPALAQTPPAPATASTPAPAPADVASADAILAALYDVISGDAGVPRDWNRFRSLFHPSARLMPIAIPATGPASVTALSPDDYIARAEPALMRGFHEHEIARRTETFGRMTHVFSTYDSRRAATDAEPFARGINSIQLFDDGTRWWILSVYWQGETPTIQLPAEYLPTP